MQKYRVSKAAFHYVLRKICMRSTYTPSALRLVVTLKLLASGGYQWLTCSAHTVCVAQNTFDTVASKVLQKLNTKFFVEWIQCTVNVATNVWFYQSLWIIEFLFYNYNHYNIFIIYYSNWMCWCNVHMLFKASGKWSNLQKSERKA